MSNENFRNEPNHQGQIEPGPYVIEPSRASSEAIRTQKLNQRYLQTWLGLMTGLSVLSLALVALLAVWLNRVNNALARQTEALKATQAEVARYKAMDTRTSDLEIQTQSLSQNLISLNQQVSKGLPNQIRAMERSISSLQKANSKAVTPEQMEQSIQRALKGQQTGISSSGALFGLPNPLPNSNCSSSGCPKPATRNNRP